ncbi:hypothetical protein MK805_05585 [Shimazuella sp. AN120528]|uniref:hypothetical protein n=1 Tax=Shimazuella soli TaxID=1892854 RepID=UPI001F0DCC26|nr:hypothetical protein [Shimazuella soli]MCH5584438.1 hypothetical protein [Shimazuella soli]
MNFQEEAQRVYEMRQKALHDEVSKEEAYKEAYREGRMQVKERVAKMMLQEKMDIQLISKVTGLLEDIVLKWKNKS